LSSLLNELEDMKWRSLEESTPGLDIRPLREIYAERKALIAKYVPAETQAIHGQAFAELNIGRLPPTFFPLARTRRFSN
jgi:hypothetical protein